MLCGGRRVAAVPVVLDRLDQVLSQRLSHRELLGALCVDGERQPMVGLHALAGGIARALPAELHACTSLLLDVLQIRPLRPQ